jgi:drug/metabolite transporter (DMT)-like permease
MFSVALFYSINFFTVKVLFLEMSPFPILALRSFAGLLFFGLAWRFFSRHEKVERQDIPRLIACGIFGITLNQVFFLWGLSLTSEFHGAVLMLLTPVFVFVLNHLFLARSEKINWVHIVGLIISTTGATWLILQAGAGKSAGRDNWLGDIMILVNAASYGLYLVLVKPLIIKYKPVTILAWMFLLGGPINIVLGLTTGDMGKVAHLSPEALFGLWFLIIGATLLAYLLNAWAMIRVSPVWVGMYIYLQPILTLLMSAILWQGSLTLLKLAAAVLIFIGVALTTRKPTSTKVYST